MRTYLVTFPVKTAAVYGYRLVVKGRRTHAECRFATTRNGVDSSVEAPVSRTDIALYLRSARSLRAEIRRA